MKNVLLTFTYLERASLIGANLEKANLAEANLYAAFFDSTYLWQVNLGEAKNIRYIHWEHREHSPIRVKGSVQIYREGYLEEAKKKNNKFKIYYWEYIPHYNYFIGEEELPDFQKAEITYRDLKTLYQKELLNDIAKEFHFRENEVIIKGSPWYWRILRLLFLKLTYGYGSRPFWLFYYSLAVIGIFTVIFAILTIPGRTKSGIYAVHEDDNNAGEKNIKEELLPFRKGLLFVDCFYFSLLSFSTFGYGALQPRQWLEFFRLEPVKFKPVGWARIFVGLEAAIGIYLLALLATVLFGR